MDRKECLNPYSVHVSGIVGVDGNRLVRQGGRGTFLRVWQVLRVLENRSGWWLKDPHMWMSEDGMAAIWRM